MSLTAPKLLSLFITLAMTVVGIILAYEGRNLHYEALQFPIILFGIFFTLIIYELVSLIREYFKSSAHMAGEGKSLIQNFPRLVFTIVLLIIYYYGMQFLGFLIMTFIFVASLVKILGLRFKPAIVIFIFALPLATYMLFAQLLNMPLPGGIFF